MRKILSILFITISIIPLKLNAQGRSFIREAINEYGQCRNVSITKTNGDLMLYGRNGYASNGCPQDLISALKELNYSNEYIDDVQLTEAGRWLILYGNNGFRWNDIPYSLEKKIREYNTNGEVVYSVTFNDDGDWIVISENYYSASSSEIQEWLKKGADEYGKLWTACITSDAAVAVYENGYRFLGNYPQTLRSKLLSANFNVVRLKIAGSAWFFSDGASKYNYDM